MRDVQGVAREIAVAFGANFEMARRIEAAILSARREARAEALEEAASLIDSTTGFAGDAERHRVARACLKEASRMVRALAAKAREGGT